MRPRHELTDRQREAMTHALAGRTLHETAELMGISPRTVETHRLNIMRVMGARNVRHLIAIVAGKAKADPPRERKSDNPSEPRTIGILPSHLRAARALLRWPLVRMAKESKVNAVTLTNFENGHHQIQRGTETAILEALRRAGVDVFSDETAIGVHLRKGQRG
jgi:DNA-binding CsgD family transcriptional regulator